MMFAPEMYTLEGDAAVIHAMDRIKNLAENDLSIRSQQTLWEKAAPILKEVAARYPEVHDTEPRHWIAGELDYICAQYGWAYDEKDDVYWY